MEKWSESTGHVTSTNEMDGVRYDTESSIGYIFDESDASNHLYHGLSKIEDLSLSIRGCHCILYLSIQC